MADEIKQQEKMVISYNFTEIICRQYQTCRQNATAFQIFMFICEHMDGYNALMASYQVFMDYTDKSKDTIRKAIKYLYDNGFVDILKSGTSNVYIINQDIAWTSYGNQRNIANLTVKS